MSLPIDLLALALRLSNLERGRPRQASLRRSVSTSYYALFHLLTSGSIAILGPNLSPPAVRKMQRWFEHGEMKRAAGMFVAAATPKQISSILAAAPSADLETVAVALLRLQEARHQADYDLDRVWTRAAVQEFVQVTEEAFASWARIRRTHEANVFAIALFSAKLFDKER